MYGQPRLPSSGTPNFESTAPVESACVVKLSVPRAEAAYCQVSVPVAPANAVIQSGQGPFVYEEKSTGVFERVKVTVEAARNGFIPILSGVRPGDRVVVEGALLLGGN